MRWSIGYSTRRTVIVELRRAGSEQMNEALDGALTAILMDRVALRIQLLIQLGIPSVF